MTDVRTTYLGLELRSPIVASSSPATGELSTLRALEESGVGAVVLPSLFEEQIEHEELDLHAVLEHATDSYVEASTWFPELDDYNTGPQVYLDQVRAARATVDVPVIASLNGVSPGGWVRYAALIEEAGASALELNVYDVVSDPKLDAAAVELRTAELVRQVCGAVSIPVAVKVGPFYTAFGHTAAALVEAGAAGLVLFNRFVQPDIDLETLSVAPRVHLSTEAELLLSLRWIALLHGQVGASLAGTSGVHGWEGALKLLLAGADVAMTASAVLRGGPGVVSGMVAGIRAWMEEREYASVEQLKGSLSHAACREPEAFERASYMRALTTYAQARP